MTRVDLRYFFNDHNIFPWTWYKGVPKMGRLHSYLVDFCKPYATANEQILYSGKPSLRELRRLANMDSENITSTIVKFCDSIEKFGSRGIERDILSFLQDCPEFVQSFQKRVDVAYLAGDLIIPGKYLVEKNQRRWDDPAFQQW